MGLQSAMTTALTGMQAAETTIDVIGNNVANSNTVGFKSSEVIFATQFLQTQSIGSAPSDSNGGTNPRQIGLGAKVAAITPNFNQGTIEISSNGLDLAIQGDGFLMVQGGQGETLYTRNGQLSLNSENEVVTSTGNKLLGYGVNDNYELQTAAPQPIEIPLGGERVAQATSEATFQGVLNPTVEAGTLPGVTSSEVLLDGSTERIDDTDFDTTDLEIVAAPSAGTATAVDTGSATPLGVGTYRYRLTYVDADGNESSASTEFSTAVTANDEVDLSALPVDSTGNWTGIRIYRTEADGTTFYELTSLANAAIPSGYTDTVDDATLTGNPANADIGDSLDNGTYSYYVTYYNSSNGSDETVPSDLLGPFAVNDNTSAIRLDLSDIDAPDDPNFNTLRIYRNASGDTSQFYLVDEVPVATANVYVDKTASSELIAGSPTTLNPLGGGSARAGAGTFLTDLQVLEGGSYVPLMEAGTLTFTGLVGGSSLTTQELAIDAGVTTVQDLMNFMTDALGLQTQSNVSDVPLPIGGGNIGISDGALVVTSNYGESNSVSIPLTAFRLTPTDATVSQTVPITFSETQEANGPGTTTEFLVYDSLGSPITVRINTVLETADANSTTYRWYATSGDSNPASPDLSIDVGNGVLVFDSQGNLVSSPANRISINRELTAGESPLEVELDFGLVTSLAETNSSGEAISSFNVTSQNGFPPGVLTDFIITESGLIQGQFSNGTQRTLGQVLMARFANNQGLSQEGNSLFATSVNSGEPFVGTPGEDGLGAITAGAVELSNTDIGQDLVEMILAQTQYQAGSRVISTAQELLDELLALQR